jgi:FkbM family methyltransferase
MAANQDAHAVLARLFPTEPPRTIIEVGSHYGQDTIRLRKAFPKARIIAFEPDPRNIYQAKLARVHLHVEYVEAALSDTDGAATFHLSDGIPPGAPKAAAITG